MYLHVATVELPKQVISAIISGGSITDQFCSFSLPCYFISIINMTQYLSTKNIMTLIFVVRQGS